MFNSDITPSDPGDHTPAVKPQWDVQEEYDTKIEPMLQEAFIWAVEHDVPFVFAMQLTGGGEREGVMISASASIPPGSAPTMYMGARLLAAEKPADVEDIFGPYPWGHNS
jgi:hypothetical protein